MLRKSLLAGVALLLTASVAEPFPLGGSSPNTGGGGGGGGGTVGASTADALTSALKQTCAGCWFKTSTFVPTHTTIDSVKWNCAAQPCASAPANAPTATTIAGFASTSGITEEWAGGSLDTDDEMMIVWGGGHQGYWGNEIYGFKLATLQWSRLSVPSDITGYNTATDSREKYPSDGMPVSSHTYDGQTYVPSLGLFSITQCGQADGGCSGESFKVLPSTLDPTLFNKWVALPTFNPSAPAIDVMAHWDSVSNAIYATSNSNALYKLASPFSGTWNVQGTGNDQTLSFHQTGAIQPGSVMAVTGGNSDNVGAGLRVWSLSTGNISHIGWLGDSTIPNANAPGFAWNLQAGKFIGWAGGSTLYLLDPATWTYAAHTPAVANTVTPACTDAPACSGGQALNGTFGRFQYDAAHNVALLVNSTLDTTYGYKPDFCGSGSPSPDGSVMIPPSPCTLIDVAASAWTFPSSGVDDGYSNITVDRNGVDFTHTSLVEINNGGNLYFQTQAAFSPYFLWFRRNQGNGEFYQVASGSAAVPSPPFTNSTTATTFQSMQDMFGAAGPNQTLTAHVMPTGIPAYSDFGTVNQANTTLNCDAGVIIAASNGAGPGQGIFAVEANGFTVSGCEISWTQATASNGPNVGIQIDHGFTGFTGTNLNLHDNDMNILGGGQTGAITLTNVTAKRGGSKVGAGSGDGFNHNIYLSWNSASPDTDSVTMTGGGSFDVTADGDDLKFRLATGTIKGVKVGCDTAGNEGTHAGCWENWPVDIGCGGQYTLGAAGAGNGIVIERSPGAVKSQLVSFGEDIPAGAPNCPNVARASQSLVITNAILIDDGPVGDGGATTVVNNPQSKSVTVSNSKLVCGANSSCASIAAFLGTGVTNGGGNTLFANRAAAGLAAYPALPSSP